MPQDDIAAQWKSFDQEKRTRLLGKMSPEQKKKLRGMLEAKPNASAKAAPEIVYTFRNPREFLQQDAARLRDVAQQEQFKGSPDIYKEGKYAGQRPYLERLGHGLLSTAAETGAVAEGMVAGLGDWKNQAAIAAGVVDPAIPAAYFMAQGTIGGGKAGADIVRSGVTPENTQDLLLSGSTVAGAGASAESPAAGRVARTPGYFREKFQPFARKVTGVEPTVKEAVATAAEKHGETLASRPAELKEHFEKTRDVKSQNAEAEEAQSRKSALNTGIDKMSTELGTQIGELDKQVRAQANEKYAAVREKVGDATVPHEGLVQAVKNAEGKLKGSAESIKVFQDIMGRAGDDVVMSGGKPFGPGTTLYESVKASPEGIPNAAKPVSFSDLQGYYSELGDKLSSGNLPGDVYQAMKSLREDIGGKMQQMADSRGAGAELGQAQKFYHEYMDTFRENAGPSGSGSPVAQARLAKDPAYVRKPFTGDSGNRGVEMLAKYSPELAKKARAITKYQTEADTIPNRAPKAKESPAMPPKPEAPTVDVNKTAREAIAQRAKNWGSFNARDIGILSSGYIGGFLEHLYHGGGVEFPVAVTAYEGGKYAASRALQNPRVIEWLVRTPPEEAAALAKIPGADKIKIVDGLTQVAVQSGKPVTLSPAARQLLGPANVARIIAASTASIPKTPGEARARIQPPAPH